jgi:hypothetical protein
MLSLASTPASPKTQQSPTMQDQLARTRFLLRLLCLPAAMISVGCGDSAPAIIEASTGRSDDTASSCSNAVIDNGEDCEVSMVADCEDFPGDNFAAGPGLLACANPDVNPPGCFYVTSLCTRCGNEVLDPGEECDGDLLGDQTCETLGFAGGDLQCYPAYADELNDSRSCRFNTTACLACGHGVLDPGEECDETQSGVAFGEEFCADPCGSVGKCGDATCEDCMINVGSCVDCGCGNGLLEPGETCDCDSDGNCNLNGNTCETLDSTKAGELLCDECTLLDATQCCLIYTQSCDLASECCSLNCSPFGLCGCASRGQPCNTGDECCTRSCSEDKLCN